MMKHLLRNIPVFAQPKNQSASTLIAARFAKALAGSAVQPTALTGAADNQYRGELVMENSSTKLIIVLHAVQHVIFSFEAGDIDAAQAKRGIHDLTARIPKLEREWCSELKAQR